VLVFTFLAVKLLNVRLGPEESRMVAELRREGIQISGIVRQALRSAYIARRKTGGGQRRPSDVMAEIYAEHPDPPGLSRPRVDLRDRRSVRRAILKAMKRPRK
jgi:hypothetical protein